ncbi:MAG: PAS domain S-box protein, partial [Sterolibacterium sp.]
MPGELRILLLEDEAADAELTEHALQRAGLVFSLRRADSRETFIAALREFHPDLILADFHLPAFDGLEALALAVESAPEVPFIFVSGAMGEELAIETLRQGAADYVLKGHLNKLVPAVNRALHDAEERRRRRRAEQSLKESEEMYRTLVRTIPDLVWLKDPAGVYLGCNPQFERFFGAREADIIGKTDYDFVPKALADSFRDNDRKAMAAGKHSSNEEWLTFADGGYRGRFETIKTPMRDGAGKLVGVLGVARDITQRVATEEKLRELSLAVEQSPESILITRVDGTIEYVNEAFVHNSGYSREEAYGKNPRILHSGNTPRETFTALWHALAEGRSWKGEL